MPMKPPRPCKFSGCPELTRDPSGYCARHKRETAVIRPYEKRDPFYASNRWIKLAKNRPDLAEKVRMGKIKPMEAQRQMKKQ